MGRLAVTVVTPRTGYKSVLWHVYEDERRYMRRVVCKVTPVVAAQSSASGYVLDVSHRVVSLRISRHCGWK